ncbi:MAG: thiol-disulfide isomerase/thioredoxin [bacterium]|jgi:thiol-disulfide isomerase/thioredoxin
MRVASLIIGYLLLSGFSDLTIPQDFDFEYFKTHYQLIELSSVESLKGKVVLVEFWASWCLPCRVKNGELNKTYSEFKDNGFEIISVALDTDSSTWRKAIINDRVSWPIQVMDTAKWNSTFLEKSNIFYLPTNVLLDSNGKVIARELYGQALGNKLKSVL